MYTIIPYHSIGNINLNSSISLIEQTLGKGLLRKSSFFEDTIIGKYREGITIEYKLEKASFIGVISSLEPVLENYSFLHHSFDEILIFFKSFSGKIFTDYSVLISDFLGVTCYFEDDQLKEVGIYAKDYKAQLVGNLKII